MHGYGPAEDPATLSRPDRRRRGDRDVAASAQEFATLLDVCDVVVTQNRDLVYDIAHHVIRRVSKRGRNSYAKATSTFTPQYVDEPPVAPEGTWISRVAAHVLTSDWPRVEQRPLTHLLTVTQGFLPLLSREAGG